MQIKSASTLKRNVPKVKDDLADMIDLVKEEVNIRNITFVANMVALCTTN